MFFYKKLIVVLSLAGVLFLLMHEFDAFRKGEWKMFGFLGKYSDELQSAIFLTAHVPFIIFLFYYLFRVLFFKSIIMWMIVNIVLILHFLLHILAIRWKSNVFHSIYSFLFIGGGALSGIINLCLISYY
jgi:hypothetical protein